MAWGEFDMLLEDKTEFTVIVNKYSVVHTDIRPGVSFYDHVTNTVALLKRYGWIMENDMIVADNETTFKLHCKHVSDPLITLMIILYTDNVLLLILLLLLLLLLK